MADHFTLDVDPDQLSVAIRHFGWLRDHLTEEGGKLGRLSGNDAGWTGVAATAVHGEMHVLSTAMTGKSATKASNAVTALTAFRSDVEDALTTTLPSLNKQWDNSESDYSSAVRKAESAYDRATDPQASPTDDDKSQAATTKTLAIASAAGAKFLTQLGLTGQYDAMVTTLEHSATRCGSALAAASPITFSDSQWAAVRGGKLTAADLAALRGEVFGQSSVLHLSDVFKAAEDAQRRIAAGESPESVFGTMDPGILDELIQRGLVPDSQIAAALAGDPKVKAALAAIGRLNPVLGGDLSALNGLTPAERQAVLASLSDDQLKAFWNAYAHGGFTRSGLDGHWGTMDMETYLLSVTSPATVGRLVDLLGLNPKLPNGAHYGVPAGPFATGPEMVYDKLTGKWIPAPSSKSWTDINQGQIGDCWFLASLAALGHDRGDGVYDGMVNQNLNGTVGVRLYDDDGHPHTVTVDNRIPLTSSGSAWGVHGDPDWGPNDETWPDYVEKAMAHSLGTSNDYESINGDTANRAIRSLTGGDTHGVGDGGGLFGIGGSPEERVSNIRSELAHGHSVFIATQGGDDDHKLLNGRVVSGHLYFVRDVLPDGRVVLANPWGLDADPPSVVLTPDELEQIQSSVDATDNG